MGSSFIKGVPRSMQKCALTTMLDSLDKDRADRKVSLPN
nr:MAG TPA: hypothetical protein [Caudoviricetes sp.]